jgi:hypothetical protein
MGVKVSGQNRSSAVIVGLYGRLNCANVEDQANCTAVCSVRIEGVRDSNPLSSTQVKARFPSRGRGFGSCGSSKWWQRAGELA